MIGSTTGSLAPRPARPTDLARLTDWLRREPAVHALALAFVPALDLAALGWDVHAGGPLRAFVADARDGLAAVVLWLGEGTLYVAGDGDVAASAAARLSAADGIRTVVGQPQAVRAVHAARSLPAPAATFDHVACALAGPTSAPRAAGLREAWAGDAGDLMRASLDLFREEAGVDLDVSRAASLEASIRAKIDAGRYWCIRDASDVLVFKAGALCAAPHVAQLEGVWVAPAQRRRGIARRAVGTIIEQLRPQHRHVTLHVGRDNAPARTLYRGLGFAEVGAHEVRLYDRRLAWADVDDT